MAPSTRFFRTGDWQLGPREREILALPAENDAPGHNVISIHRAPRARLGRLARESVARLATAEAAVEAVSDDVDARSALMSEIEALEGEIKEKEARRTTAAEKLAALRAVEPDVRLEEREAVTLSARELARARARKAVADLEALLDAAGVEGRVEVL